MIDSLWEMGDGLSPNKFKVVNRNNGHPVLKPIPGKKKPEGIVVASAVGMVDNMNWDLNFSSIRS